MIVRIPKATFDALAGYIRGPESFLISRELEWYTDGNRRVLGALVMNRIDEDFAGAVLGRDARHRFRAVAISPFCDSPDAAHAQLVLGFAAVDARELRRGAEQLARALE